MSDCISVIGGAVSMSDIGQWLVVGDMTNVLCTVELEGVSASGSEYTADPFYCIDLTAASIRALVLHPCGDDSSPINRMQMPVQGVKQIGDDVEITLCGWCETSDCPTYDETVAACDPCEDPCARYHRLRCCLEELMCGNVKASVGYRDRQITFSRPNIGELRNYVESAKTECQQSQNCGKTGQRRWRQRICDW